MKTRIETVYTAAELREHHPRAFERAWSRHRQGVYEDPAWAHEHLLRRKGGAS